MSKLSSSGNVTGMVCSNVFFATSLPSTDNTPVPPLPRPGPSGLKSNTMVCLPAVSSGPSHKGAFELVGTVDECWLEPETNPCCRQAEVLHIGSTKRVCGRGRREN